MSALAFGCGPIGGRGDAGRVESLAALETAWEGGIRHFDTAPSYGDGAGERLLGEALRTWPRHEVVVSSKVGRVRMAIADPYQRASGTRRDPLFDFAGDGVRRGVLGSLGRLGLSFLDTVLVHDPDAHLDLALAETFPTLDRLRSEGVVRSVGVGTTSVTTARRLVAVGVVDVVMIANAWSLTRRQAGVLLDECLAAGVGVLAAAPFDSGLLASSNARYLYGEAPPEVAARVAAMARVCHDHGVRLPQAALQFPLRHKAVRLVVTGMRSPAEVTENLALLADPVPEEVWPLLDQLVT
ncbi:aldo/keto reductase [Actinophytocola oryzae]|uniref:D-threo-aldose 1-dehydrogenase n=1 Tax=Actinophytocola oryzae TaxID=502181 RepID=A0A4R7W5K6_9PSEU|nr:aldo/keto reductase [Actinophytocola oryzae]TDV57535.1 D-threo-aldose 1-dehydrogenase [Actinophytocola oryzae]